MANAVLNPGCIPKQATERFERFDPFSNGFEFVVVSGLAMWLYTDRLREECYEDRFSTIIIFGR